MVQQWEKNNNFNWSIHSSQFCTNVRADTDLKCQCYKRSSMIKESQKELSRVALLRTTSLDVITLRYFTTIYKLGINYRLHSASFPSPVDLKIGLHTKDVSIGYGHIRRHYFCQVLQSDNQQEYQGKLITIQIYQVDNTLIMVSMCLTHLLMVSMCLTH